MGEGLILSQMALAATVGSSGMSNVTEAGFSSAQGRTQGHVSKLHLLQEVFEQRFTQPLNTDMVMIAEAAGKGFQSPGHASGC